MQLPAMFVSRMKEMMGEEELAAFLSSYDYEDASDLPRALRINPLKLGDASREILCSLRHSPDLSGFGLESVPWAKPYGFYYGSRYKECRDGAGSEEELLKNQASNADGTTSAAEAYDKSNAMFRTKAAGEYSDSPGQGPEGLRPEHAAPFGIRPGKSPLHDAGLYYIQEPSAMAAAALLQLAAQAECINFVPQELPRQRQLLTEKSAEVVSSILTSLTSGASVGADAPRGEFRECEFSDAIRNLLRMQQVENEDKASVLSSILTDPYSRGIVCRADISVGASNGLAGKKILDLCAAPGGKTTMLSSMLGGQGLLVSNDVVPERARILSQNVERMGIVNAVVTNESPERLMERFPCYYDRVIVDAPCSGEGMFRREEQAITTWSPEKVASCAQLQAQILDCAAVMVRSGGLLVYSTCTFAPEEDEIQTVSFLASHPEFELVDLPGLLGGECMREYGFETGRPEWVLSRWKEDAPERRNARETAQLSWEAIRREKGDMRDDFPGYSDAQKACRASEEAGDVDAQKACRDPEKAGVYAEQVTRTIRLWPHRLRGEGHFIAAFRKSGTYQEEKVPTGLGLKALYAGSGRGAKNAGKGFGKGRRSPVRGTGGRPQLSTEEWTAIRCFIDENLSIDIIARCAQACGADAVRFGDEIYLMPYAAQIPAAGLKIMRCGLHFGTLKKGRFEPAHALAMALRPEEAVRCVNFRSPGSSGSIGPGEDTPGNLKGDGAGLKFSEERTRVTCGSSNLPGESPEAAAFLRGEALPCDPHLKGWTLIAFDGISAGWAKASGGMLRNHYPKGLRREH